MTDLRAEYIRQRRFLNIVAFITIPTVTVAFIAAVIFLVVAITADEPESVPLFHESRWVGYITAAIGGIGFLFLKRNIGVTSILCPKCQKNIFSSDSWICGYCEHKEPAGVVYPFIYQCRQCSRPPLSYTCPHCSGINLIELDRGKDHPAVLIGRSQKTSPKPEPKIDPAEQKRKEHLERKADLEREIELTQLNMRLANLKASAEFKAEKSAREKLGEKYTAFETDTMGLRMLEREERLKASELLANNPELLEMKNLTIDAFVEDHGYSPQRLEKEKGPANGSLG